MHLLGRCKYRYARNDECGLTVMSTRYGPGHVAAPKWAHYPVLSTAAAVPQGVPTATADGSPTDIPVSRVRRAVPVKAG